MATLEELKKKLADARQAEYDAKELWKEAISRERENPDSNEGVNVAAAEEKMNALRATRKLVARELDDAQSNISAEPEPVVTTQPKPAPKPAVKPAPKPIVKSNNKEADRKWFIYLRRLGRRPVPRPAGWGE